MMSNLQADRKKIGRIVASPVVKVLEKTPVTPNMLTWFGSMIAVAAGVVIGLGHPFIAGFIVLFGGLFDMLDGALARRTDRITKFGGILDSTLDRVSESVILIGLLVMFAIDQSTVGVIIAGITWLGSFMVSYIRSRAEAAGMDCQVGVFTRPERVIIISLGLLLSQFEYVLIGALALVAVLSLVTASQRLLYVWQQTKIN